MSLFWNGFENGLIFGMLRSTPMFGCFNSFMPYFSFNSFNIFSTFTPFIPQKISYDSCNIFNFNVDYPTADTFVKNFYKPNCAQAGTYPAMNSSYSTPFYPSNIAWENNLGNFQPWSNWGNTNNSSNSSNSSSRTSNKASKASRRKDYSSLPKNWSQMSDEQIRQVYGNYDRDVTKPYAGNAESLNKFLNNKAGNLLKNKGSVFMEAQKKYGINAVVLIAIMGKETSYAKAGKNVALNNPANIRNTNGQFKHYSNVDEAIMDLARLLRQSYVDNPPEKKGAHLTKLYQINARFCPVQADNNDNSWASGVENCASSIEKYIAS